MFERFAMEDWLFTSIFSLHGEERHHNSNLLIDTSTRLDSVPAPHCLVLNGVRPQLLLPVSSTLHGSAEWHWVRRKRQLLKRVSLRRLVPVPSLARLVPEPIDF